MWSDCKYYTIKWWMNQKWFMFDYKNDVLWWWMGSYQDTNGLPIYKWFFYNDSVPKWTVLLHYKSICLAKNCKQSIQLLLCLLKILPNSFLHKNTTNLSQIFRRSFLITFIPHPIKIVFDMSLFDLLFPYFSFVTFGTQCCYQTIQLILKLISPAMALCKTCPLN